MTTNRLCRPNRAKKGHQGNKRFRDALPLFFVASFCSLPSTAQMMTWHSSKTDRVSASGAELKSALLLNFSFIAFKIFTG